MTYATVMVSLALDRSNEVRLEIAGQLVDRFGARVIGITAGEFSPPLYFTTGEEARMVIDQGQAAIRNLRVWKVSFAHRCRTVLRSWNGAAQRNFQPDSSSNKPLLP